MGLGLKKKLILDTYSLYRKNMASEHTLRSLFWECTLRCPLSCGHCGSDCKAVSGIKDMPVADFLKVIDSITPHVDPHKTFIIITGGEPLARKDIEVCGRELYRREFPWGMVTNGFLLDRKRLDSLLGAGLHTITVSLDGFEAEHNWLRKHPESFARAVNAIKMIAAEKEIVWDVVTCVNQKNYPTLHEFKDFLVSIGVRNWRLFTIFPSGRAAENPELTLSGEQVKGLMEFIKGCRQDFKSGKSAINVEFQCEGFMGEYELEVRNAPFHCDAGISVGSVLVDGSISACPSIRANFHQGNIYKDDFWTVWNTKFEKFRDRSWTHKGICADCRFYKYCQGNGMHLYNDQEELMHCNYKLLTK